MGCTQSAPEALGARAIEIERAKALFVKFDEDNSGSIDSEELINLLSDLRGVEVSARCELRASSSDSPASLSRLVLACEIR